MKLVGWAKRTAKSVLFVLSLPLNFVLFFLELDRLHFSPRRRIQKGRGCVIDIQTWLVNGKSIRIGNYVKISAFSTVMAGFKSTVEIGDYTIIGPSVLIASFNHGFKSTDTPIRYQPWDDDPRGSIKIGRNVWIGGHVVILPGVTIGENTIVGAGSIVTKSIPPNSIFTSKTDGNWGARSMGKLDERFD